MTNRPSAWVRSLTLVVAWPAYLGLAMLLLHPERGDTFLGPAMLGLLLIAMAAGGWSFRDGWVHGWDAFRPWAITTGVWAVIGFPVVGAVIVGRIGASGRHPRRRRRDRGTAATTGGARALISSAPVPAVAAARSQNSASCSISSSVCLRPSPPA